ncbi:hypothetical protein CAter282_1071 [Collimonas arenae]|uniref:Uncharacterized protein n=1 Tax=Collimonas arenae TaxID=279058 RepID=A0A127PMK0_9BURK|nr:hypothetical protein CAter10_1159 [Collimonas arenae]AMP08866.1 hypothetical protein CAter282_1071 [Collimonas arenae]
MDFFALLTTRQETCAALIGVSAKQRCKPWGQKKPAHLAVAG